MIYLSVDLEATGLAPDDLIIEFAAVAVDTKEKKIYKDDAYHTLVQCPLFEELEPKLDQWVIDHNKKLISKAAQQGISLNMFKQELEQFILGPIFKSQLKEDKICLLGKSMNAIDIPFLKRDLGHDFMDKYFSHRILDVTSLGYYLSDAGILPKGMQSGTKLMKYFDMGEVAHTALEDAVNTAQLYLNLLEEV